MGRHFKWFSHFCVPERNPPRGAGWNRSQAKKREGGDSDRRERARAHS